MIADYLREEKEYNFEFEQPLIKDNAPECNF